MSGPAPDSPKARMPIETKAQLIEELASGSKPKSAWKIGTEHEKFPFLTATLKPVPGEHTLALYSGYVTKYRHNPGAVLLAEAAQKQAEQEAATAAAEAKKLAEVVNTVPAEKRAAAELAAKSADEKLKAAKAAKTAAVNKVKAVTAEAAPKDIADILVSEPIRVRVLPADKN